MPQRSTNHEATLWRPLENGSVQCELCGQRCVIAEGKFGICRVRENVAGALRTHSYGSAVAINVDPIEKKPLFHVLPGTRSLSFAAAGCNFQCEFCQNWQISQAPRESEAPLGQAVSPEQLVTAALTHDCQSISYTYTEPTIFFEMAYDTSRLAHQRGLRNVFVSNGYLTPAAIDKIGPHLDAINVDLKAFRDETYRRVMKARLEPVLVCLRALRKRQIWTEVTTLVVPGMNDSAAELKDIATFIAAELGPEVPWHVSRFHGDYHMTDVAGTPLAKLQEACQLGLDAGLMYVYCGNVPGQADESTYCPQCHTRLIERVGFNVRENHLRQGKCSKCQRSIEGIWE